MNSCQRKFLLFGLMLTNIGSLYAADGFSNSNDPTKAQQPTTAPDMLQQNKEKIAVPEPVTKVDNLIGKKVSLTDIRFTGNTVYSELELKKEVADLLGKANLSSDTETIRLKITRFYIKNGYISSGALIEDTGESDGILKIRIIEGKLIDVHEPPVTNKLASDSLRNESMWPSPIQDGLIWLAELVSQPLPKDYLKERLLDGAGEPFNLNELQDKYRQMLSDPLIKQMTSQVVPGLHPGEAMLNLQQVQRNKPYQLFVGADDYSTPAVGGYTGRMGGWVDNLFRQGERIDGQFAVNGGGNSYNVGISVPVTAQDTRLSFRFSDSATTLVEAPFNKLNLTTHIIGFDGGIAQPVYRTVNDSLVLGANFVVRESRTLQANSCSSGAQFNGIDGDSNCNAQVTVLRMSQRAMHRGLTNSAAFYSTFNAGLDALGATTTQPGKQSGQFFSWLGQSIFNQQIWDNGTLLVLKANMQLANSALLPLERFSLGGVNTVRGYRENSYIRDNGFNTNVEIKLPIHNSYFLDTGSLFLVPFMDYGGVWNNPTPTLTNPTNNYLFSSGIGFNWLYKQVSTDFYWAHAFTPVVPAPSNRTIQDDGIHFRVTINAF